MSVLIDEIVAIGAGADRSYNLDELVHAGDTLRVDVVDVDHFAVGAPLAVEQMTVLRYSPWPSTDVNFLNQLAVVFGQFCKPSLVIPVTGAPAELLTVTNFHVAPRNIHIRVHVSEVPQRQVELSMAINMLNGLANGLHSVFTFHGWENGIGRMLMFADFVNPGPITGIIRRFTNDVAGPIQYNIHNFVATPGTMIGEFPLGGLCEYQVNVTGLNGMCGQFGVREERL